VTVQGLDLLQTPIETFISVLKLLRIFCTIKGNMKLSVGLLPLRSPEDELALELILLFCDGADGLFNSVMNEASFSSAVGQNYFSLSTSAWLYVALIDYDEAFSSPVITILISDMRRRTERIEE